MPAIWELETTNVLRSACLRQRLDAQRALQVLAHLAQLPIEVDRHPVPRSELPLATRDKALAAAALAAGVGVVPGG